MSLKLLLNHYNRFLFEKIDPRQYAALRIGLGLCISGYWLNLLPLYPLHFGPNGWLGSTRSLDLYNSGDWSLLFVLDSDAASNAFFWFSVICSGAFTLGFLSKISGWASLVALISLWNRNPLVLDGDDAVLRVMLLYLLFSPCGRAWSIDNMLRPGRNEAEIWPLRLIQMQMAFIYLVSGWVKFHSPEWLDGTILQYVLIHPEYTRWNFSAMLTHTWFLNVLYVVSSFIMWWELLFPLLLLNRKTHTFCLLVGILFHVGLLIFMQLRGFSLIMLTLYIAFIPSEIFHRGWRHKIKIGTTAPRNIEDPG